MSLEILTVGYWFKSGVCEAVKATVNEHPSPVVNIMNGLGFSSQVTGQSINILTPHLYLESPLLSITAKSTVQYTVNKL